jgi:hypothetical protein
MLLRPGAIWIIIQMGILNEQDWTAMQPRMNVVPITLRCAPKDVDGSGAVKGNDLLKLDSSAKSPFYGFLRCFIFEKPLGFNIFCGRGRPRSQEIGLLALESNLAGCGE